MKQIISPYYTFNDLWLEYILPHYEETKQWGKMCEILLILLDKQITKDGRGYITDYYTYVLNKRVEEINQRRKQADEELIRALENSRQYWERYDQNKHVLKIFEENNKLSTKSMLLNKVILVVKLLFGELYV